MASKDRRIIAAPQAKGRMSNQEPPERVSLSPSPASEGCGSLSKDGWSGAAPRALVDEAACGLPVTAAVRVRSRLHGSKSFAASGAAIGRTGPVLDRRVMAGAADRLLRVPVDGPDG